MWDAILNIDFKTQVHKQNMKEIKQEIQKLNQKQTLKKINPHKSIHLDQIKETLQNM